jgi:hypothetical protein
MGTSPATQPTQNRGQEMKGMQKLALLVSEMPSILGMVGATSEVGQAVNKAIGLLAKHVPPGSASPAGKRNEIQDMALQNTQNAGLMQQLQQRGAPGGAPPPQPGAPPPMAA